MAAIFTTSNIRMGLIYIASVLLAVGLAIWGKCTSHRNFNMCYTLDIALAAVDFSGDALFVIEASEKGAFVLAVVASTLLGLSSLACLCVCPWIIYHYHYHNKNDLDTIASGQNALFYAIIMVLSATNPEVIKLFPWTDHSYDGFPQKWLAVRVTQLALVEDIPQLVCQVVFIATVDASPIAMASLVVTVVDLMVRVIKRTLRVMAAEVHVRPAVNVQLDSIPHGRRDRPAPPPKLSRDSL